MDVPGSHTVKSLRGIRTFLPPALPPPIEFTATLISTLSRADRALGELAGTGRGMPSPTLFTRALLRREAVLSSRIEGTQTTLSDLVLFELDDARSVIDDSTRADAREVANYVRAMDYLLDEERQAPLGLWVLREAHRILLTGVRGDSAVPGEFRTDQNWIGSPGAPVEEATYVPPPPERLPDCLDAFEQYLRGPRTLPPLVDIAVLHYHFEAVHPFRDGNGRVGRLLVSLLLAEWGLLPGPLLDFSAYIEPRREEYYARLLAVSARADWAGWIAFFLEVVAVQARDVLTRVQALQKLRENYRSQVTGARSSSLLPRLVDEVFVNPAMTIADVMDVLHVTHRAATTNLEKLVEQRVLVEVTRAGRVRRFLARDVLAIVNGNRL
ncbi:Fic family protein [Pseudonocardia sp.]|uniref:Fic family protein n=1 Tax=Pseudonocardia sp. TaxID=60912 RepID=UPI0026193AE7|nr:Fic family protein [Pseudonocardia sp.]